MIVLLSIEDAGNLPPADQGSSRFVSTARTVGLTSCPRSRRLELHLKPRVLTELTDESADDGFHSGYAARSVPTAHVRSGRRVDLDLATGPRTAQIRTTGRCHDPSTPTAVQDNHRGR
jgi:hypothetical protein